MSGTGRGTVLTGELGTWLREQREARGWARRDMARRLIQAGHDTGDTAMPGIDSLCTYIRRWEHGHGLTERYKLHFCTALAIPPAQFGQPPAYHSPTTPVPADSRLLLTAPIAYRGTYRSEPDRFTVEREVLMTAHESSDHAEHAAQPGISDLTLEQLRTDGSPSKATLVSLWPCSWTPDGFATGSTGSWTGTCGHVSRRTFIFSSDASTALWPSPPTGWATQTQPRS
jgi:transcriptional regulator with XRE-family HTH domain